MQDRAAPGTAFGSYTQLACFARPRRLHQTTLPIAERVSSRKPSGTSSSAQATSAEPAAANVLVPAANIAAPPSSGTAQHAAQAAPAPATAFQGFISISRHVGTSPAVGKPKCSSDLRIKQITENELMEIAKTVALFVVTALAEIVGCYLPYLWLKQSGSPWLLVPAAISLALFAWLLSLHPTAAGRVYAAYGGVYILVAIVWLMLVDKVRPAATDWVGVAVSLAGMAIIMFGRRA